MYGFLDTIIFPSHCLKRTFDSMNDKVYIRVYEELNDYLPPGKRKTTFSISLKGESTTKDVICLLGIPPEEVDLVLVNSESVPFSHSILEGDRVSIYPIFESIDISSITRLRDKPLIKLSENSNKLNRERR